MPPAPSRLRGACRSHRRRPAAVRARRVHGGRSRGRGWPGSGPRPGQTLYHRTDRGQAGVSLVVGGDHVSRAHKDRACALCESLDTHGTCTASSLEDIACARYAGNSRRPGRRFWPIPSVRQESVAIGQTLGERLERTNGTRIRKWESSLRYTATVGKRFKVKKLIAERGIPRCSGTPPPRSSTPTGTESRNRRLLQRLLDGAAVDRARHHPPGKGVQVQPAGASGHR